MALGGIFGAQIGFPWLDPVGGLIVATMILRAGTQTGWQAVRELTDGVSVHDRDYAERVRSIARNALMTHGHHRRGRDNVDADAESPRRRLSGAKVDVPRVRLRKMGTYYVAEVQVDCTLAAGDGDVHGMDLYTLGTSINHLRSEVHKECPDVREVFVDVHRK